MKKTLVIGASLNPSRYSYLALKRLSANSIETVAIGLKAGNVSGISISTEREDFKNIDTVSLYLNPKRQEDYYQYIVGLQPRRVLFNPGTENPQFYEILKSAGITVEEACTLVLLSTGQY
ncbi:CoA-binding protein [Galbibacter sp.]|jgi:predicted CoA-binding protein|uniref:CoA-binding protein n=1 Tax=Galbibacter sp. TaxID=2918471 RepID=UPI003A8C982D